MYSKTFRGDCYSIVPQRICNFLEKHPVKGFEFRGVSAIVRTVLKIDCRIRDSETAHRCRAFASTAQKILRKYMQSMFK